MARAELAGRQIEAEVARTLQAEEALAEEREARAALEAQLARLEGGQAGGVGDAVAAQRDADELRQHLSQAQDEAEATRQALAETEARAAEMEVKAARLEKELAQANGATRKPSRAADALSAATPSFMQSSQQGSAPPAARAAAPPPPAAAAEDEEDWGDWE